MPEIDPINNNEKLAYGDTCDSSNKDANCLNKHLESFQGQTDAPKPSGPPRRCGVVSGPTYTPGENPEVTTENDVKETNFSLYAKFADNPEAGLDPSCCEVRQKLKWDSAFHESNGGPPHSGFPPSSLPNMFHEDRPVGDGWRYGHRGGRYGTPEPNCGDEYRTGNAQDQQRGNVYCGRDNPGVHMTRSGQWTFKADVIDRCNGNVVRATSRPIIIKW